MVATPRREPIPIPADGRSAAQSATDIANRQRKHKSTHYLEDICGYARLKPAAFTLIPPSDFGTSYEQNDGFVALSFLICALANDGN